MSAPLPLQVTYNAGRFHADSSLNKEFFTIYHDRLEQLRPLILPQFDVPVCEHLNQMVSGTPCAIIGVVYKNLSVRQNILDMYKDIGYESQAPETLERSDKDALFIEDNTGRIELVGIPVEQFCTGVVIGVRGTPEAHKFIVSGDVIFPEHIIPKEINVPISHRVIFISDLCINSDELKDAHKGLMRLLNGVDLAVYLGNNFLEVSQPNPDEMISFNERISRMEVLPTSKLESFLKATKSKNIIVMPGEHDPCTVALPQQPYHPVLLSKKSYTLATNPSSFIADELSFLCDAGESPTDITKTTAFTYHQAQCQLLNWRLIAPTAPDQLPCVPVQEKDLLVMEETPNVFASGLANEFDVSQCDGVTIIAVPSFMKTRTVVEFDTKTREAKAITI